MSRQTQKNMLFNDVTAAAPKNSAMLGVPFLAWVILAILLGVTALVWRQADMNSERTVRVRFQLRAEEVATAVSLRMRAYELALRGGVGLFSTSNPVSREDWRSYVTALAIKEHFPGIQGMGFSLLVHPAEKEAHVRLIRSEGFPDYDIKPPGERSIYTSIVYLEPFDMRNRRAFGFDMFSEPARRDAMERARDTGEAAVSSKVVLKQETEKDIQSGFLMYLPLYRKAAPLETVEQRRAALLGYVYSPFRMNDLMRGILGARKSDVELKIYDGASASAQSLMYDSDAVLSKPESFAKPLFSRTLSLKMHGHPWTLVISSEAEFEARIDRQKGLLVMLGGGAISLLLFSVIWALATHRARAQQLAREMTAALREREGYISAILNNAADGIVTIDEQGRMLTVNRAAERIFAYGADEMIGQNIKMLMPEPYHSSHDGYLEAYRSSGERKIIGIGREVSGLRKSGEVFPLDLAVSEVRQGGQRVFAGIVRDITERKKVDQMKSEFVSVVSHELRTPLTSIRGALGLIAGGAVGALPEKAGELVKIAHNNSERLLALINDLLDIESITTGKMQFDLKPHFLMPLVEQAIQVNQPYGEQYSVEFRLVCGAPDSRVNIDPSRFSQVLTNLYSNAAKFSPAGSQVEVAVQRQDGSIRITVSDCGPGIPDEFRDRIFQKFSQADSSDSRQKGGTGLGLSITKAIVEHMNGWIDFESSAAGTSFTVSLPEWHEA